MHKEMYHDQCHEYNQLIENAKTKYYNDKISDCTHTNFFRVADSILKVKTTPILSSNKSIQSLMESFAQYFEKKIKLRNGPSSSPSSSTTSESGVTSTYLSNLESFHCVSSSLVRKTITSSSSKSRPLIQSQHHS